jgi:uncharacterized protein GlcG (DUF336 family)
MDTSGSKFRLTILKILLITSIAVANSAINSKQSQQSLLNAADVELILRQAGARAQANGLRAVIVVVDHEGRALGDLRMNGISGQFAIPAVSPLNDLLAQAKLPFGQNQFFGALSKAVTGAFLSSQGHAFSSRTASFIVQEHFPPGIDFVAGGPLFGVQFSQLLLCSDVNAKAPLGLSGDPGGIPLYKNGVRVGGLGVEGDGIYFADKDPTDFDQSNEEIAAVAGSRGFEAPSSIRGEQIVVNGIRFPYVNASMPDAIDLPSLKDLGTRTVEFKEMAEEFHASEIDGRPIRIQDRFFPPKKNGGVLTIDDVTQILVQALRQANKTRAAIRRPLNSPAEVNMSVVDVDGTILGIISTPDAPRFGLDVSVQKGRTAAFFTRADAGVQLASQLPNYVEAAARDGIRLDGSVAFSDRAVGFLSRPFFPDGINETQQGPFSVPIDVFSPFNVGLQLDLLIPQLKAALAVGTIQGCTGLPGLKNGLQIFAGSVPLYKNGQFAGAIGVSGDGIDQDDLVAAMGSTGFESPTNQRSDRVFVRDVRLPFVKFPRHPNLD